jgi:hypothetical protein
LKGKKRSRRTRSRTSCAEKQELFAYDGTTCIGRIVTRARSNHAFNAAGKLIGKFSDPTSAFRSISEAHLTATKARPAAPTNNNTSDRPEWRDAAA